MSMKVTHFLEDEAGAVTTDWVLLCATLVSMAIVITALLGQGGRQQAGRLEGCLQAIGHESAVGANAQVRSEAMAAACNDAATQG